MINYDLSVFTAGLNYKINVSEKTIIDCQSSIIDYTFEALFVYKDVQTNSPHVAE